MMRGLSHKNKYTKCRLRATPKGIVEWVVNLKTGERTLQQEFMSMQEPVAWNADLSQLLFASPRNGNFDIYRIDVDAPGGAEELRVRPLSGEVASGD